MERRQALVDRPVFDEVEERLLDEAAALIATRGIGGLTIAELAREARVSRPTVYRRWSSTDEVVRAALLRQTMRIIDRLPAEVGTREQIVAAVLRFADLFAADPVFARLLEREPDAFTRYSLERVGSSQRFILRWLGAAISRGQDGGTVRDGVAADMAVMLLLIAQSAILSHRAVSNLIGDDEWRIELRVAVDGYLRP